MIEFEDREAAGRALATALSDYRGQEGVVCALPRGGVPLGAVLASTLKMPLDLLIPRKIGHPMNPEYAIGAIAENGELVSNKAEIKRLDPAWLRAKIDAEKKESQRRRLQYLGQRTSPDARGKILIIVDDGIATGLTMEAAILDARARQAAQIVVAVPVAPEDVIKTLGRRVDRVVSLVPAQAFRGSVGAHYRKFPQLSDAEVISLLAGQQADPS